LIDVKPRLLYVSEDKPIAKAEAAYERCSSASRRLNLQRSCAD